MAFVLGVIALIVGVLGWILGMFANGMSDAPSMNDNSGPWVWLFGCLFVVAVLIGSHYVHWAHIGW